MSMDQAAFWLAGSILTMLGFVVVAIGILIINNLFSKYWKAVTWLKFNYHPVYFDAKTGEPLVRQENTNESSHSKL